jgi:prepilin-type N-terminal cleavage/methylation domain-containing protein
MTAPVAPERPGRESGLTLVEVLVALAVIGAGVAGLAAVVPVSTQGVHEARQLSTATFLAEQMLERTRAAAWAERPPVDCLGLSLGDAAPVPSGATCDGATSTRFPDETAGVAGAPQYRRRVRVHACLGTPCAGATTARLRRVEVIVDYVAVTAAGVAPARRALRLERLVAQR